jgi:hypothetical protein
MLIGKFFNTIHPNLLEDVMLNLTDTYNKKWCDPRLVLLLSRVNTFKRTNTGLIGVTEKGVPPSPFQNRFIVGNHKKSEEECA